MEETISLKELFDTLKKRIGLITSITLLAVMVSGLASFFLLTPIYQSSTQLLVNKSNSGEQAAFNTSDIQTNLQLINTYSVIMKSPVILEKVIDELNLETTVGGLNEQLTVQSQKDSQVVGITVQSEDPQTAVDIANKTAEVFQREIVEIMNVDNITVLAKAEMGDKQSPIKPQPVLNMAIALVVGLMTAVGLAFLLEFLDNTVKTEQDVEKLLELPVLGVVTKMDNAEIESAARRVDRNRQLRGETLGS
ncbi:YveK family protein [Bacillus sp. 2205SS5-2]|uniref:YveK family protein n=1 Tax=Bacillus sp. 2205SS5-2 TaxID=3109031 RepID=UPI0030050EFA